MNVNSVMQSCVDMTVEGALKLLGILSHLCAFLFGCMYLNIPCACLQESSLMVLQASLKGELEANQQQLESSKVAHPALSLL